jgi:hypothetical protein
MSHRRYNSDPFWMNAKLVSQCPSCSHWIQKGERIFYYPSTRSALCAGDTCGGQAERDLSAAKFDESNCVW